MEATAPLSGQHPHDARSSGSGLGAAPWSKFALQRQPSVRQAALEQLPTPMPFTTGSFRVCASGSRTANNGVHQLSLRGKSPAGLVGGREGSSHESSLLVAAIVAVKPPPCISRSTSKFVLPM